MNQKLIPLFSLLPLALAACLGGDPDGDGGTEITHAAGHWQLNWVCDQQGETLTGCDIGDIYDVGRTADGVLQLGVAWGGDQATGTLRANALSMTFEFGAQGSPEYWTEDAVYTFDRTNPDVFEKSSTYGGNGVSGICSGTARRIPATQTECLPVN